MAKNYSNSNNSGKNQTSKNGSYSSCSDMQNKNKNSTKNSKGSEYAGKNCGRSSDAYDESDRY